MNEYRIGYPSKKKIRKILRLHGVDVAYIYFSDAWDIGKRGGIFWERNDMKKAMIGIDEHFEKFGIKFIRIKEYGVIHSIHLTKIKIKI